MEDFKMKRISNLSILIILLAIITSSLGLFWQDNGESFFVENVNGDKVKIFGNGLYAHESYFKAPINKGTDAVILFIIVPLFIITLYLYNKDILRIKLLHLGLLSCLLYYSASLAFGAACNRLFVVYILLFSASLFTFIIGIHRLEQKKIQDSILSTIPHKSMVVFLVIVGLSVFVWLIEIIGSIKTGNPPGVIGINTTEPTFVFDIGIIAPLAFYSARMVYERKPIGYLIAILLLTLNSMIGLIVISQTIFQYTYGVIISIKEFIPYVVVFVAMSFFATLLNIKTLQNIKN
jgi:hypothetical protein